MTTFRRHIGHLLISNGLHLPGHFPDTLQVSTIGKMSISLSALQETDSSRFWIRSRSDKLSLQYCIIVLAQYEACFHFGVAEGLMTGLCASKDLIHLGQTQIRAGAGL